MFHAGSGIFVSRTSFGNGEALRVRRLTSTGAVDTMFGSSGFCLRPVQGGVGFLSAVTAALRDGSRYLLAFDFATSEPVLDPRQRRVADVAADVGHVTRLAADLAMGGTLPIPGDDDAVVASLGIRGLLGRLPGLLREA